MVLLACPKCGESLKAIPPNNTHKKLSKYPDRNTMPIKITCNTCGYINTIFWKQ